MDAVLGEAAFAVTDDKVSITEMRVSAISGLTLSLHPSPGNSHTIVAKAGGIQTLTAPKQVSVRPRARLSTTTADSRPGSAVLLVQFARVAGFRGRRHRDTHTGTPADVGPALVVQPGPQLEGNRLRGVVFRSSSQEHLQNIWAERFVPGERRSSPDLTSPPEPRVSSLLPLNLPW